MNRRHFLLTLFAIGANEARSAEQIEQRAGGSTAGGYPITDGERTAGISSADRSYPPGNVLRYGADPTFRSDSSGAFQRAIDAVANYDGEGTLTDGPPRENVVRVPSGWYRIEHTLVMRMGVVMRGSGWGNLGASAARNRFNSATALIMPKNTNLDLFRFNSTSFGSNFVGPNEISDMQLLCLGGTRGHGVHFSKPDGAGVRVQDQVYLHRLLIRGFPESGIRFPRGAGPIHVQDLNCLFNNDYGIHMSGDERLDGLPVIQGIHFDSCSFDGNTNGGIRLDTVPRIDKTAAGHVTITALKSEARDNRDYPDSGFAQQHALVLVDCDDTPITISGATHISSVRKRAAAALICIRSSKDKGWTPRIDWSGVGVRTLSSQASSGSIISNEVTGDEVPAEFTSGCYGGGDNSYLFGGNRSHLLVADGTRTARTNTRAASASIQLQGKTPGIMLQQTDRDAHHSGWVIGASSGDAVIGAIHDDGTPGTEVVRFCGAGGAHASSTRFVAPVAFESTVGFFGSAPSNQPIVTGSRGGSTALEELLQALQGLGLVVDKTTS